MAFLKSGTIPIRHGAQQQGIRRACQVARDVLIRTASQVAVGITTAEVDRFAAAEIKAWATASSPAISASPSMKRWCMASAARV